MEIKVVDNLKLTESLGEGKFGKVFLTEIEGKEGLYATKRLDRALFEREENIKMLYNEITILKQIKHPNVVNYIQSKKTKNHIYIVMEYCNGGTLFECLKKYIDIFKRPFKEEIVQYLMRQIINGLDEFHSNNILHRDLKLDNILINFPSENDKISLNMLNSSVKISDFGFSSILKNENDLAKTTIGTPVYMPPEMIDSNINKKIIKYGNKADIWSLGVLCYQMLTGNLPFFGKTMNEIDKNLKYGIYKLPRYFSQEAVFFIQAMLQENPEKRLNCKELLKQDFLNKDFSQLQKKNPKIIPGFIEEQNDFLFISILDNSKSPFIFTNK